MRLCGLLFAVLGASFPCTLHAEIADVPASKDNVMYSEPQPKSNGQGEGIMTALTSNSGNARRALIEFAVEDYVPAGSTIDLVELRLVVLQSAGPAQIPVNLHRVLAEWGEGMSMAAPPGGSGAPAEMGDATWLFRFFNTQPWAVPGGDFAVGLSATSFVGEIGTTASWSSPLLAADVQVWLDDPALNHGWSIIADTNVGQGRAFRSLQSANAAMRPVLRVNFTNPLPIGACCYADATCGFVLEPGAACVGVGVAYQGDATSCQAITCPPPSGACCSPDVAGTCGVETEADCEMMGGTYDGDFSQCVPDLCPAVPTPFVDPLPLPMVAMPVSGVPGGAASYELSFVQFDQQLHSELPATTVWGFDDGSSGPSYPGPTFEARSDEPVDVIWSNQLRENGELRTTHFLPVDSCVPDAMDEARVVIHLHGGHIEAESDGHPMDSIAPGETDLYNYSNKQTNATLWYHDHTMGSTRLGVQMGLAGFYLLRDDAEDMLGLPSGANEIPMVFQDRTFNTDGSLRYPTEWAEHIFGRVALVNGRVWPFLNVNQGKYRFRWLNGSSSRTYRLALSNAATFNQIGSDGGLLTAPVPTGQVTLMPGERADVVVDFESYAPGTIIELRNDAPAPYPGGGMEMGALTNVMRFVVQGAPGHTAALPSVLQNVDLPLEEEATLSRDFILSREPSEEGGCAEGTWQINRLPFEELTEMPQLGTTEIWRFINASAFAHPMHIHLVMFRVLDRQPFVFDVNGNVMGTGPATAPILGEAGYKDTVRVEPFEMVRVVALFEDYVGDYVYHCHILEHEDNEMMRQFQTFTTCGDGAVALGLEECDDNNDDPNDACPTGLLGTCLDAFCGDGIVWGTDGGEEMCDDEGETAFCDDDCTIPVCGDDVLNAAAGEECDDGNGVDGDGCSAFCGIEGASGGSGPSGGGSSVGGAPEVGGSGGSGAGGSDTGGGGSPDDSGGCNCHLSTSGSPPIDPKLWLLAAMALMRRRRSRRATVSSVKGDAQ